MTKFTIKFQKIILVFLVFIAVFIAFELKAKKEDSCEYLVNKSISTRKISKSADKILEVCARQAKTGEYKELYAYYKIYKYVDIEFEDKMEDNKYHWMLFYANQNSRDFDEKTQSFKKEKGLYEQELKDFEDQMTQEEKIKSFSYIADNLAAGKEGWIKKNDYEKSFEYLKRAAEAGDVSSQYEYGACNFLGRDRYITFEIPKNYIESYKWIYLSTKHSKQGNYNYQNSKNALITIGEKMTEVEIKKAQDLIKLWLNNNVEFIKSNPLEIFDMNQKEVEEKREEYKKFIDNKNHKNN